MSEIEKETIFGDTSQEVLRKYDEWYQSRADKIELVHLSDVEGPKVIENSVSNGYRMHVEYKKK
jgi:sugar phosphate isomerase/epimerase